VAEKIHQERKQSTTNLMLAARLRTIAPPRPRRAQPMPLSRTFRFPVSLGPLTGPTLLGIAIAIVASLPMQA
jgi:hypothetical protein